MSDFTIIDPRIVIGNLHSRALPDFSGIVSVITTTERPGIMWAELPVGRHPLAHEGTPLLVVDIADGESWAVSPHMRRLEDYLTSTSEFIAEHSRRGMVLIHCWQGKSRSAAVATAFLCAADELEYEEGYARIKAIRPEVDICPPFERAVRNWLRYPGYRKLPSSRSRSPDGSELLPIGSSPSLPELP